MHQIVLFATREVLIPEGFSDQLFDPPEVRCFFGTDT